jgi:hypothetical protein
MQQDNLELPEIQSACYGYSTIDTSSGAKTNWQKASVGHNADWANDLKRLIGRSQVRQTRWFPGPQGPHGPQGDLGQLGIDSYLYPDDDEERSKIMANNKKGSFRIVRVIVADPNENLSVNDRVLYDSGENITELEDQELFFELEIKQLLVDHNAKRLATLDKEATKKREQDVYLEPIRIKDLQMRVVTLAEF